MSPSPPAPSGTPLARPILFKLLIGALLVSSGVQAWEIIEPAKPMPQTIFVPVPASPEVPSVAAEAANESLEEAVPHEAVANTTEGAPKEIQVEEEKRYVWHTDFEAEVLVSSTPAVYTPWTGNGPPTVLVYYDGITDVNIKHSAYLHRGGFVGFDTCSTTTIKFENFTSTYNGLLGPRVAYQSLPLPGNAYHLLGSGENCYARAVVESNWRVYTCMEGDGTLAKATSEVTADGITVRHVDVMDYCFILDIAPPETSSSGFGFADDRSAVAVVWLPGDK